MKSISDQFSELNNTVTKLLNENKILKDQVQTLTETQEKYEQRINELEAKCDEYQQIEVSKNIIVSGLPQTNISSNNITQQIIIKLNINPDFHQTIEETQFLHQNPENQKSNLIIVKFKTIKAKQEFLQQKQVKRSLTIQELEIFTNTNQENQIFFRDHLTKYQLNLYRHAKTFQATNHFKYCWIKNSSILLRNTDTSKVFTINSENDFIKIRTLFTNQEREIQNTSLNDTLSSSILSSY